jgi:hypothetical protein
LKSHLTDEFIRCFQKAPRRIQRLAKKNYRLWKKAPFHPSLQFKYVGKRLPVYAVRVGIGWRALGLMEGDTVVWFWIGPHAEYDSLIRRM